MNKGKLAFYSILGLILVCSTSAYAHYLWVTIEPGDEVRRVNVIFEHSLEPGDGAYIPHFIKRGKTWLHDRKGTRELPVVDTREGDNRWLSASINKAGPLSIESFGLFGVYRYGKEDVQLHYYAKHIEVDSVSALNEVSRSEKLDLDIVPSQSNEGEVTIQILWKGKPSPGRKLSVRGASSFNLETDESGSVAFRVDKPGLHTFFTSLEDETPGTDPVDKKDYLKIRHQSTLVMSLPIP